MKRITCLILLISALAVALPALGQRRVNPVKSASTGIEGKNENRNPADSIDYSKLVRSQDANGNVILVDTITGREVPDTTQTPTGKVPKMENRCCMQPLWASTYGIR